MQKIIIITAILACTAASPALLLHEQKHDVIYHTPVVPVIHQLSSAKSTLTKSHQVVNHGGTAVLHTPVIPAHHVTYHEVPVHTKTYHAVHSVVPSYQSSVVYSSPVVGLKGASAVSHHSSTVHETVPVVNHLPLYALHH